MPKGFPLKIIHNFVVQIIFYDRYIEMGQTKMYPK